MRRSVLVAALLSVGCTEWDRAHPIDGGAPLAPDIQSIQTDIFTPRCALGSCHGSPTFAASLDLSSVERSCAALVGTKSCLFNQRSRVVPGQPEQSYLYNKLVGENLGTQPDGPCAGLTNGGPPMLMPYGGARLSDDHINQVRAWILSGARCDAPPQDAGSPVVDGGAGDLAADAGGEIQVASLTSPSEAIVAGARTTLRVTLVSPANASGQLVSLSTEDATALAVPMSTFVAAGELSATFEVEGLRPARSKWIRAHAGGADAEAHLAVGGLSLAELFYSSPDGIDDGMQWVKLANSSAVAIDLSRYSLGGGRASYIETTAPLSGVVEPGACFVVGGPKSSDENGWPSYSLVVQFVPPIPHPTATGAAGVALFDVATASSSTLPLDAVIFGASNSAGLLRPDGSTATPDDADVFPGDSLVRTASGWQESLLPNANACN
jgi:hypothetical protein